MLILMSDDNVLILPDLQYPFQHPDALEFLAAVADEVKPAMVLNVGDEIDNHAVSTSFKPNPNAPSAGDEFDQAKAGLDDLERLFPVMYLAMSNHTARIYKKAADSGIPGQWLKTPSQAFDKPNWIWEPEWYVPWKHGQVCVYHGDRMKGALKYARLLGTSVACGHHHQEFGIQFQNSRSQILFGMDVGCLVDKDGIALQYANQSPLGQMLGCGAIVNGWPTLFAMETDEHNRWTGRLV